jgi:hypothetical protein
VVLVAVAIARLAPKARVVEKPRLPLPLEMGGPTPMNHTKAPAMRAPVMEIGVATAAGHHTPVSGLPRDLEWPMLKAEVVVAEEVVATAQEAREEARELAREVALATPTMMMRKMTALQVTTPKAPPLPERQPAMQVPQIQAAILTTRSELPEVRNLHWAKILLCKEQCYRYVSASISQLYNRSGSHRRNCGK